MIKIDIPGEKQIHVEHLVLDFNGTLAVDGKLIIGTRSLLETLSKNLSIHIVTADTFGTAQQELDGIKCSLKIINSSNQLIQKEKFMLDLGHENVIAIGNGRNDLFLLKGAILGIAVIQGEGIAWQCMESSDIICNSIIDALELLINPVRITATLRI